MTNLKSSSATLEKTQGFSLVEMAVVLVILGMVLATLIAPITVQRDIKNIVNTQSSLNVIKEAINGFVILNARLPCPAKLIADPADPSYGLEDLTICGQEGLVPWKTLGVSENDEWGMHRYLIADQWVGYWRYKPDVNFTTTTLFASKILADLTLETSSSLVFADKLLVQDSSGNALTPNSLAQEKPIAIIYSTGKDLVANGKNAGAADSTYESDSNSVAFDDILVWITRPLLVNRVVSAGKLP